MAGAAPDPVPALASRCGSQGRRRWWDVKNGGARAAEMWRDFSQAR